MYGIVGRFFISNRMLWSLMESFSSTHQPYSYIFLDKISNNYCKNKYGNAIASFVAIYFDISYSGNSPVNLLFHSFVYFYQAKLVENHIICTSFSIWSSRVISLVASIQWSRFCRLSNCLVLSIFTYFDSVIFRYLSASGKLA